MDAELDEISGINVKRIQAALLELRELDFKEYKAKLPNKGRCTICTLKVPCKHFSAAYQIPRAQTPLLSPSFISTGFNVTEYLPKLTPETYRKGFSIRSRGKSTVYNFDLSTKTTALPNEQKLKQLEAIESYREEKLKREIEKIHQLKAEEAKQKEKEKNAEEIRKSYLERQRQKLREYQESFNFRKEKIREIVEMEQLKKRKEEEKRQRYVEEQKIKLEEYYEKKNLLKKISRQKVLDLEDEVIHHKPIRIRHFNDVNKTM